MGGGMGVWPARPAHGARRFLRAVTGEHLVVAAETRENGAPWRLPPVGAQNRGRRRGSFRLDRPALTRLTPDSRRSPIRPRPTWHFPTLHPPARYPPAHLARTRSPGGLPNRCRALGTRSPSAVWSRAERRSKVRRPPRPPRRRRRRRRAAYRPRPPAGQLRRLRPGAPRLPVATPRRGPRRSGRRPRHRSRPAIRSST